MNYKKVKSIVFDILESCDCEDERICEKCPFANHCMALFTGDWGDIPHEEENLSVNEMRGIE